MSTEQSADQSTERSTEQPTDHHTKPPPTDPLTPRLLRDWPLPPAGGSKYERGDVLVVGGARATPGAAMLAGLAALRVGSGRLTLAVAESVAAATAVAVPEAAVRGLVETGEGGVRGKAADQLEGDLERADVVVVGPGLDDIDQTQRLLESLVPRARDAALVLDAYALGALASTSSVAEQLRQGPAPLVLTPNLGEAAQLLDRDTDELGQVETGTVAREIAQRYGAVVSLQGVVTDPSGRTWESTTGHPGLATSGSGDVLAGAVAGLIARGAEAHQAACWGAYVHAAAGDRLAARVGPTGFLARELLDELPAVLVELTASES